MIARRIRSTAFGGLAIAACVVTARPDVAFAQDAIRKQIWLDYNPRIIWPSGFEVYGDIGVRTELSSKGGSREVGENKGSKVALDPKPPPRARPVSITHHGSISTPSCRDSS